MTVVTLLGHSVEGPLGYRWLIRHFGDIHCRQGCHISISIIGPSDLKYAGRDKRIVVAKQRALKTSNFVRYVFHTRTDIRDHRRERWCDPSIAGSFSKWDKGIIERRTVPSDESNVTHWVKNLTPNVYLKLRSTTGLVISKPLTKPWLLYFHS